MQNNIVQEIMDELDDLLEDERRIVLEGDLAAIPALLKRKENLFDQLEASRIEDAADLELLQTKVSRNQALLEGALRGIRAVADRMSSLRQMRSALETYDRQGHRQTITVTPENRLEKRA